MRVTRTAMYPCYILRTSFATLIDALFNYRYHFKRCLSKTKGSKVVMLYVGDLYQEIFFASASKLKFLDPNPANKYEVVRPTPSVGSAQTK